jgi:hypothetical protein
VTKSDIRNITVQGRAQIRLRTHVKGSVYESQAAVEQIHVREKAKSDSLNTSRLAPEIFKPGKRVKQMRGGLMTGEGRFTRGISGTKTQ